MKSIQFNTEMVKAILDGRKVQTRRVVKNTSENWKPSFYGEVHKMKDGEFVLKNGEPIKIGYGFSNDEGDEAHISKYKVGETIFVAEDFSISEGFDNMDIEFAKIAYDGDFYMCAKYRNDGREDKNWNGRWRDADTMISEFARIFLKITNVRVERLQDITFDDVFNEGCPISRTEVENEPIKDWWTKLWNSIYGKGVEYQNEDGDTLIRDGSQDWDSNPFVFAYEFEKVKNDTK